MTTDTSTATTTEEPYERKSGPVHAWFSLSYANFLVWHRAHMQSMPLEWQRRFTELAEELDAAYPDGSGVDYEVATVRRSYVNKLTDAEMSQLGITTSDDEDEDGTADRVRDREYYLKDGHGVPGYHYAGIPVPDPIPHYRHAYLPPDEAGIAAQREFRADQEAREAASEAAP